MVSFKQIVLKNAPESDVNFAWGQPDSTFEIKEATIDESSLKDGDVFVKVLYLSNDPTQRISIQKGQDPKRAYSPPVQEGQPVVAYALAEVIESKSANYSKGDIVNGAFAWSEYLVVPETSVWNKIDTTQGLPLPLYQGTLGATGLTAYFGLKEVGQLKEGQSVLISAASGATGSMAVQIAKHILKAKRVIGITGSDEKGKWVESLGADFTVNYNDPDYQQKLSDYIGDDYVDLYYDNVGGEILSFALTKVKRYGHVTACGAIAGYNDPEKLKVGNWGQVVVNRLNIRGFIVSDFADKFPEGVSAIVGGVKSGVIKINEGTHVEDVSQEAEPLKKVPEVWKQLFTNQKPNGKLVTKLA